MGGVGPPKHFLPAISDPCGTQRASTVSGASTCDRARAPVLPAWAHRISLEATWGSNLVLAGGMFERCHAPTDVGMPVRWRRKADELQKVSDEDSDEVDQDPVSGATSEISISSPSAEATEDLLPDERAEATMKHDTNMEMATKVFREVKVKLELARMLYKTRLEG